jgi:hypothetical protein
LRVDVTVIDPASLAERQELRFSVDPEVGKLTVDWVDPSASQKVFALQLLDGSGNRVGEARVSAASADPIVSDWVDADKQLRAAQLALNAATNKRDSADRIRNQAVLLERQYTAELPRAKSAADRSDLSAKIRAQDSTVRSQTATFEAATGDVSEAQRRLQVATTARDRAEAACKQSPGEGSR